MYHMHLYIIHKYMYINCVLTTTCHMIHVLVSIHVLMYYVHYNTCTCVLCTLQYMSLRIMYITIYMYVLVYYVHYNIHVCTCVLCTCVLCTCVYIMYMYIHCNYRVKFSCNYSNNNCSTCNY